jgi:mRNA interferase YafQ
MYSIRRTGKFKKDVKLCIKRGYDLSLLAKAMQLLVESGELPEEYAMHPLKGKKYLHSTIYDVHILPDWILLFAFFASEEDEFEGEIVFIATGTHSDLFK